MINFKASTCHMQHTTKGTCINDCTYIFKAPIMSNHWPLMPWHSSSYLKTNLLHSHLQSLCWLLDHITTFFGKIENSLFAPCLDRLFNLWNNAVCRMNYWVHIAGKYRATSTLGKSSCSILFNCYQFDAITYMPDEIVLARMVAALDLEL